METKPNKNRIKFLIDNKQKTIIFWFSEKELRRTIKEGFKRNMNVDDISKTMTGNIADVLAEAMVFVEKTTGVDVRNYKPILKMEG